MQAPWRSREVLLDPEPAVWRPGNLQLGSVARQGWRQERSHLRDQLSDGQSAIHRDDLPGQVTRPRARQVADQVGDVRGGSEPS